MKDGIVNLMVTDEQFQTILNALWNAKQVYQTYGETEDEAKCVNLWNELYKGMENNGL